MTNYVTDFITSAKQTYNRVCEDRAAQLWIELADEMIAADLITDEDQMEIDADELMEAINEMETV